jgi:hypothetical protein
MAQRFSNPPCPFAPGTSGAIAQWAPSGASSMIAINSPFIAGNSAWINRRPAVPLCPTSPTSDAGSRRDGCVGIPCLSSPWHVLRIFRYVWVHEIPRLCIRNEEVELWDKPAWIVEAGGEHSDDSFIGILCARQARSAFWTKPAQVVSACLTLSCMALDRASRDFECPQWNDDGGNVGSPSDLLTIATMTLQHYDRLGSAFVAHLTADAAAGKWEIHNFSKSEPRALAEMLVERSRCRGSAVFRTFSFIDQRREALPKNGNANWRGWVGRTANQLKMQNGHPIQTKIVGRRCMFRWAASGANRRCDTAADKVVMPRNPGDWNSRRCPPRCYSPNLHHGFGFAATAASSAAASLSTGAAGGWFIASS